MPFCDRSRHDEKILSIGSLVRVGLIYVGSDAAVRRITPFSDCMCRGMLTHCIAEPGATWAAEGITADARRNWCSQHKYGILEVAESWSLKIQMVRGKQFLRRRRLPGVL